MVQCVSDTVGVLVVQSMCLGLDDCDSGTELTPGGGCETCRAGTYRRKGLDLVCTHCRAGRTTPTPGAKTPSQCSLGTSSFFSPLPCLLPTANGLLQFDLPSLA